MSNQEQAGNGFAIGGLVTLFIGIFVMGGIMGLASIILGALALKGSAWAKVLGAIEIVLGALFVILMMIVLSR